MPDDYVRWVRASCPQPPIRQLRLVCRAVPCCILSAVLKCTTQFSLLIQPPLEAESMPFARDAYQTFVATVIVVLDAQEPCRLRIDPNCTIWDARNCCFPSYQEIHHCISSLPWRGFDSQDFLVMCCPGARHHDVFTCELYFRRL